MGKSFDISNDLLGGAADSAINASLKENGKKFIFNKDENLDSIGHKRSL